MRELSGREEAVLIAMLKHGQVDDENAVTEQDRRGWLRQLPTTRAGLRCGCGAFPSVELVSAVSERPDGERSDVVLSASTDAAVLLLFISNGQPSYLELVPIEEDVFADFPSVDAITFP